MKEFKLKSENKIIIQEGYIEEYKGDVVLNWTNSTLDEGPYPFHKLHRAAGPQLRSATVPLMGKVKTGDVFSTIAGMLHYYLVLHAVLPMAGQETERRDVFDVIMFNAVNTLCAYKAKNVCRNLYLNFPDVRQQKKIDLINAILLYEEKIKRFEFRIVVTNSTEYDEIIGIIEKILKQKKNLWLQMKHKTKKVLSKIMKPFQQRTKI